ncbi:MAG: O-antigen ligase family protein [Acidobacteriota bacterium]
MNLRRTIPAVRQAGLVLAVAWAAFHWGGVAPVDFYPVLLGLILLFLLSLADGLAVEWWGWLLLAPLVPMAFNGSLPSFALHYVAFWIVVVLAAHSKTTVPGCPATPNERSWSGGSGMGVVWGLLALGIVEALLGLSRALLHFAGQDLALFPMGTIFNRNHFAGFLEMLVPLCFALGAAAWRVGAEAGRTGGRENGWTGGRVAGRTGGREDGWPGERVAGRMAGREDGWPGGRGARRAPQGPPVLPSSGSLVLGSSRPPVLAFSGSPALQAARAHALGRAWLFFLAGGVLFLAILFSLSRGGTVSAVVGTATAGALVWAQSRRAAAGAAGQGRALAAGIGILVVVGALWIGIQPVVERFVQIDRDAVGRTWIFGHTAHMIADHPLLGVGAGMHGWVFTRYQEVNPDIFYDYAHNDYLQGAADWGLPAALVFFGIVFFLVWRAARACVTSYDPARVALLAGCLGGVAAILCHSFSDFNLQIPSNAMLFGVLLGKAAGRA